ncbi:Crp/Fnr family transcriptional regulator [Rhizorhapis suberifaciens]|uniref:CRP-like cAMP-binding protein n=1 Tax=Rhizorhapis suberifaciens TaxID=13656 RepID=A0A840HV94_9SPHN|nr:Crp/Fnr family transcriptional regulator [Rhizorhapis suberifaciens]MBB4641975.1 CRP-like cAMP-binding protein [Rhizorhapis suberifaciens]
MSGVPSDLSQSKNRLLAGLSPDDMDLIHPFLEWHELPVRTVIEARDQAITRIHFLESGILSIVATAAPDRQVEVGIIGREGMSGMPCILGAGGSTNTGIIQLAGSSLSIDCAHFHSVTEKSPAMRRRFSNFVQSFFIQVSQTALATGKGNVEQRLARWLAMAHDRGYNDSLPLTHEFLSTMLGVRRAGVTVALHNLEGAGLIRATRGIVTIVDLPALIDYADGLYGIAEQEYERLLGAPLAKAWNAPQVFSLSSLA